MTPLEDWLQFVQARHDIWEQRQQGDGTWRTDDPVLANHKFTNVFRVLDVGSQQVLDMLQGPRSGNPDEQDTLYRAMLYRYTNRPEPWLWFYDQVGRYPVAADGGQGGLLDRAWTAYDAQGLPFFSSAYTMFTGQNSGYSRRYQWAIGMADQAAALTDEFVAAGDQYGLEGQLGVLQGIKRCGQFMAQQVATDYNYGQHCPHGDPENEHVVVGPGSKLGAAYVMPGQDFLQVARTLQLELAMEAPQVALPNGRPPSLMDVQNTLCEMGKYVRWRDQPIRRKPYQPKHPGRQAAPVLPNHWA